MSNPLDGLDGCDGASPIIFAGITSWEGSKMHVRRLK
jgi:hypothetical protein